MRNLKYIVIALGFLTSVLTFAGEPTPPFTPGNIMVASFLPGEVFKFDPDRDPVQARVMTPVAGPGGMTFGGPNGHLFVASNLAGTVTEIDRQGNIVQAVAVVDQSVASPAVFGLRGFAKGPNGNLFISVCGAEHGGDAVFELDSTTLETVLEIRQGGEKTLDCLGGIGFGPSGTLYVTGIHTGNVLELDISNKNFGEKVKKSTPRAKTPRFEATVVRDIDILEAGEEPINSLRALAFDSHGNLYVAVFGHSRVAVIIPGTTVVDHTIPVGAPTGMSIGRSTTRDPMLGDVPEAENLFVGDLSSSKVLEIDLETDEVVRTFQNDDEDLDARFVIFVPGPFQ